MSPKIQKYIPEQNIHARITELAGEITDDYTGTDITVIGVLHGALFFAADLTRHIPRPLTLDIIKSQSYTGVQSSRNVNNVIGITCPIAGRHVLVIDDIIDTGLTLCTLAKALEQQGAATVNTCVLLDKPATRKHNFSPDYTGFSIENRFVVGYGLDYNGYYRNLPYVGILQNTANVSGYNEDISSETPPAIE